MQSVYYTHNMQSLQRASAVPLSRIQEPIRRYWGFDRLRPLQEEAIRAGLAQRDSLVVLSTGGGKSLCYQVPPIVAERTDIVISPLISLMKDQVDGLRECGYPAAAIHSGLTAQERDQATGDIADGRCRLVFVSPERVQTPEFMRVVERLNVRAFAVDEAHCISHWGHDFRPDYRQLAKLKERFPEASVHAYTATATQRVRADIVQQLRLINPTVLVGVFDRPNLSYRVIPRVDVYKQVVQVIRRHPNEAVIVYCPSRKDTEHMAEELRSKKIEAQPYHAGMSTDLRRRTQEAFADESLNVVTATVAFGMGIDRSNVRCIIHATMPKTVEHYQQETGRAGRDGLEAECVLLYSAADRMRWESLIQESAAAAEDPETVIAAQMELLEQMKRLCSIPSCRHRALSEHFGQQYPKTNCQACDVCLDEVEGVEDATVTAQKILSCVARVQGGYGAGYVADLLTGGNAALARQRGHEHLSTFGLLKEVPRKTLLNWMYQLVDQGLLDRSSGDRPVLTLNAASWEVMGGRRSVRLMQAKAEPVGKTRAAAESWDGVDRGLFDRLRELRQKIALERGVPAFVVFSDATLRDMARKKPKSLGAFRQVFGVGDAKLSQFGTRFVAEVEAYCRSMTAGSLGPR